MQIGTYPLTKQQVESSLAIQALQPRIAELRRVYGNNQEKLQLETARLYKEANVNPLAGCLPTLVTLPVWVGLYRALTNVAGEGLLTEGFFFIPSLAGPSALKPDGTSAGGLSWLFPFEGGAPPVGWHDAGAYLIMPMLLIVSQYVSQKLISPPQNSQDPAMKQTQAILSFLPLMIGWFSLNVPSGLTLYWFTNNVLTTAQQASHERLSTTKSGRPICFLLLRLLTLFLLPLQMFLRKTTQLPEAITQAAAGGSGAAVQQPIRNAEPEESEEKRPSGELPRQHLPSPSQGCK